jgi:uncharacterized membrane protein
VRGATSHRLWLLAWASWSVLLLQEMVYLWTRAAPWVVWLGLLLPLLIFVPGMLRDKLRSYIWLCFVSLLYFMRLVVALFAEPANHLFVSGIVCFRHVVCALAGP